MKTIITENQPKWSHGSQPCVIQWNYEPCHVGPLKMGRSWCRVLTKSGQLEKGMANHRILAWWTPCPVWKDKKIWHWRRNCSAAPPRVGRCSVCYWRGVQKNSRRNEEAELKQKGCPAVDVSGGESKVRCCKEQYFIGNIGKSSIRSMNQGKLEVVVNRRWQEGTSTF